MDVIIGVDAVRPPLTGIGRYSLQLALGLASHPAVSRVRYFALGGWVGDVRRLAGVERTPAGGHGRFRGWVSQRPLPVRIHSALVPRYLGWRLRNEGRALFHAPGFFLPPFPGPGVATVHDLTHLGFPQCHPPAWVDLLVRKLPDSVRRARHVITPTEAVRTELVRRFGVPADRITAVPHGVDAEFRPRDAGEIRRALLPYRLEPGRYSLFVGTIEPRKNIDRLLHAYEMLPGTLRGRFPLVLAGARGWLSRRTHERIERAAADGWLRYLAFVPQADLPMLYAGARLFAYPSLYEGFGLPVLEAMASGTPVVASRIAAIEEVTGGVARLVEPEDADALFVALRETLEDGHWPREAHCMGVDRSRRYSWRACVEHTIAVYEQAARAA